MIVNAFWNPKQLAGSLLLLLLAVCAPPACHAQGGADGAGLRLAERLRSFVPGASGSIYFSPTPAGGVVRVTALNLPPPQSLQPDAQRYVVWAVASGEPPLVVGELVPDAGGNGGLEFARPARFERYSVVVTAEPGAKAEHPYGAMVFASRAGAASALYGGPAPPLSKSQRKAAERELKRFSSAKRGRGDFYSEVDGALSASPDGGRFVELHGGDVTPDARGAARVASRNQNLYVRTVVRRLPPPSRVGASAYVLWGILLGGRIVYMGSLPDVEFSDADNYLRLGGINSDELDLLVSAERRKPVALPSGLRALYSETRVPVGGPSYGAVEGVVVDPEGMPVAGATVELRPDSQTAIPDRLPSAVTDRGGKFFLDGLAPGEHVIYTSKEEEGYLPAYDAFFVVGGAAPPRVTVRDRQSTGGVIIRLGAKAAWVRGRVLDAATGRPVEGAELVLTRADNPEVSFSFGIDPEDGTFKRAVPPIPLRLTVRSPGYEEWQYGEGGSGAKSTTLLVRAEATEELIVYLRPHAK